MRRIIPAAIASLVPLIALSILLPRLWLDRVEAQAPLLPHYRVAVEIDGIPTTQFKSVSGLDLETEVIEFREGADPNAVRKLPGRTKYANIVLKQGFVRGMDPLYKWYGEVLSGAVKKKAGSVVLLTGDGKEVGRYNFYEAWPCKWKGFEAFGNGSAHGIETIEIAVDRIEKAQ